MEYEAVCFDLDNTLYPYDPCNEAGKRAALSTFRERGYDLDRERFDELYARARADVKRETAGTAASHERFVYFKRALRRHADVHDAADAFAIGEAYWDGYVAEMELFDEVEETLDALREAGLAVVVVTNLTTRVQLRKLAHLDIDDRIDRLVTSEEVGREKPSALPFTAALSALDLRASEAVMVGDNVVADVEGANAVGMRTVLFTGGTGENPTGDELAGPRRPDHRIDEFAALPEVLA
ncbi:HAD family hydrolase [Halorubrum rubrum]|uniref:HAD family hydrolase n=1 Tax=Halorubrum rubrum TaxID=1126240 RepID=A0ABD5QYD4_9EURY|nr:HAD family hydrolase [Halorubrum rubrum]